MINFSNELLLSNQIIENSQKNHIEELNKLVNIFNSNSNTLINYKSFLEYLIYKNNKIQEQLKEKESFKTNENIESI
jgi:predicted metal-dependent enzyme (double-stranded beta helix superfamily)